MSINTNERNTFILQLFSGAWWCHQDVYCTLNEQKSRSDLVIRPGSEWSSSSVTQGLQQSVMLTMSYSADLFILCMLLQERGSGRSKQEAWLLLLPVSSHQHTGSENRSQRPSRQFSYCRLLLLSCQLVSCPSGRQLSHCVRNAAVPSSFGSTGILTLFPWMNWWFFLLNSSYAPCTSWLTIWPFRPPLHQQEIQFVDDFFC